MPKDDGRLAAAKRAYRNAADAENYQEEAKWANVIGNIFKDRGEYIEALRWFRIDYKVSSTYLPEKQLLATCQSLGEVYLRLERFKDALIYQKKHLELAKDDNNVIEQQRASTQLGRTYHEMFLRSNNDHYSVRNAKKYFKAAMEYAQALKENPPSNSSSFLNEFIDAHNNIGMLEMDLDNLEEAKKILMKGLKICDEEEVIEDNDGRSRLHHNLGNVYMELRMWDRAGDHIKKDISICKRIGHCQGEAKGYVNLGELHYRVQKYEEAIHCYKKALDLARSMEDEDALADQIEQNIRTLREAMKVFDELKKEELNLKKLSRNMVMARGTPGERKCLLEQNASIDRLIEKSSMVFAWLKHCDYAKKKKRIAIELCDKEKLSDSCLVIGESYQKLRKFDKAFKWYNKGWEAYKLIGNLEGQALVKINIGDVLDSNGNWKGALDAFEEGYRIAVEANLPSVQLSALENMHYSNMIRFDNIEEARKLQRLIDNLKHSKARELDAINKVDDCCSETDTEGDDCLSKSRSNMSSSPIRSKPILSRSESFVNVDELEDDAPLSSLIARPAKPFTRLRAADPQDHNAFSEPNCASPESFSKSTSGRKRVRLILSDDEGEMQDDVAGSKQKLHECQMEDMATSSESRIRSHAAAGLSSPGEFQDVVGVASRGVVCSLNPLILEESASSLKSDNFDVPRQKTAYMKSSSSNEVVHASNFAASVSNSAENPLGKRSSTGIKSHTSAGKLDHFVIFKIDNELIHIDKGSSMVGDASAESLKVDIACLYYLQLPLEKRRKGLLPIIRYMKCQGRELESLEAFKTEQDQEEEGWVEVFVDGWVQKPLMKLYMEGCEQLSEAPNYKLLKSLYNLEISEDEIIISDCELQDLSIAPLLNALHAHKTVAVLDLSHNLLGNGTLERLKQILASFSQKYGGLTLDLHCNRFGPSALFQICECPVLFTRLEVLNISGNRLTDACGSYLSTILENCKALYSLKIENCSLTTRTIQKVADSLGPGSVLAQLWLGYNNPITTNVLLNLLDKLATLKRFSELNLNGLKLGKAVVDSICELLKASSLSGLMLGGTGIGTVTALHLMESLFTGVQDLAKLDLSYCGLTLQYFVKMNSDFPMAGGITELNLGGNPITQEGSPALASLLTNPQCCTKILILNNCQLGLAGVLQILQAVAVNHSLEELHLAENTDLRKSCTSKCIIEGSSELIQASLNVSEASASACDPVKVDAALKEPCVVNSEWNQLEVADSEDEAITEQAAVSGIGESCTSSFQRNLSSQECKSIEELSTAISLARVLTLLDLSNNGFSNQASESLYSAWSSNDRAGLGQKHIKEGIIHFSVRGIKCCKVRPCCRRD